MPQEEILIRPECAEDAASIFRVQAAAFDTDAEARLVEAIRAAGAATVSLVALRDGQVAGHVLFSPVTIEGVRGNVSVCGLAPVGVLPEFQRRGIGGRLIVAGLEACRAQGVGACVLLGSPDYYPRFGFQPAGNLGLRCVYDAPPECFMARELEPGALHGPPAPCTTTPPSPCSSRLRLEPPPRHPLQ
jgi:putative acetyltransferase